MGCWNREEFAGRSRAGGRGGRRAWVRLAACILPLGFLPDSPQQRASSCSPLIEAVDTIRSTGQMHGAWAQATRHSLDPALAGLVPVFAQMRRYELEFRRADAYEAASAFRRLLGRQPRLACARYGLGRTLARGPDAFVRLGEGPRDYGPVPFSLAAANAPRELRRALELDSTLVEAAVELLRLAAELRHEPVTRAALAVPALVAAAHRDAPALLLAEARVVALEEDPDSALALIPIAATTGWAPEERLEAAGILLDAGRPDMALPLLVPLAALTSREPPGPASVAAAYLEAKALLRTPGREEEGAAAYLAGLGTGDSVGLGRYVEDIEPLVGAAMPVWQAAGPQTVRENIRWWWERSSALSGVALPERLAEHFRRMAEARRRFPLRSSLGPPPGDAVLLDPKWRRFRMDERGLVWIRQGEPERIVGQDMLGVWSEAWVYPGREGGNDIYYFTRPGCAGPFGTGSQCTTLDWTMVPLGCNVNRAVREVLAAYDPWIQRTLFVCDAAGLAAAELDLRARKVALDAWRTEGDRRHMDERPAFAADFYALRGVRGTALTAVIGIAGAGLEAGGPESDPVYRSRSELILVDTARRSVERAATSDRSRPGRRLTPGDFVRQYIGAEFTPTPRSEYRLVVTDESNGNARMAGGSIAIPDYGTAALQLSDLVIAHADTGEWRRGDVALSLQPGRVFTIGAPMYVYFEIYHQPVDSVFAVEISLRAERRRGLLGRIAGLFGGERAAVTLRYDDVAETTRLVFGIQTLRMLGTESLEAGEYALMVTITDRSGVSASRSRAVTLRDPVG